jgi:hypothetical protein
MSIPLPSRRHLRSLGTVVAALSVVVAGVIGFAVGRSTDAASSAGAPAVSSSIGPATPHDVQQFLAPGQGYTP